MSVSGSWCWPLRERYSWLTDDEKNPADPPKKDKVVHGLTKTTKLAYWRWNNPADWRWRHTENHILKKKADFLIFIFKFFQNFECEMWKLICVYNSTFWRTLLIFPPTLNSILVYTLSKNHQSYEFQFSKVFKS